MPAREVLEKSGLRHCSHVWLSHAHFPRVRDGWTAQSAEDIDEGLLSRARHSRPGNGQEFEQCHQLLDDCISQMVPVTAWIGLELGEKGESCSLSRSLSPGA